MSDHIELKVPALGESVVEATVARWHKKEGTFVETDELLVDLETDKVTLEVAAPQAGQLISITAPQGAIVQVGHVLGTIQTDNVSDVSSEKNDASDATQQNISRKPEDFDPTSTVKLSATIHTDLSPSVRKMVVENRVDTYEIQGTGKSGRITKTDIVNHLDQERLETRVPMSRLRSRIAERLKQAQNTAAILTTFNEADMSAINKLRQKYKESFEKKYGVKLGYMSFFIKASVRALQQLPIVNSRIQGNEIVTCNYIDMGVAVSASAGLVVPVVRDADLKSMAALELAVHDFVKKARESQLTIEEMSGGTFTISNGGVFGSLLSTPILNPPQSAILGMHKIQDRPVVIEGRIEVRPMMYLALSYDHRLVDGKEAVTFLVQIKESLENPESFLLEV